MKIDFYYWGMQCPIIYDMLKLFDEFKDVFHISFIDIAKNQGAAVRQRMFFPFLTVVNETQRFFAPISRQFLQKLANGDTVTERPYVISLGHEIYHGEILPITQDNIYLAGKCTGGECTAGCGLKAEFLLKHTDGIYGYLHIQDGNLLGGAEYLPSTIVPYDIPKDDLFAFLTCVYLSSSEYDYKAFPLQALEKHLKTHYDKVYAISDEFGVFPNGDLKWFLDQGYQDDGVVSVERGYCTLHLVSKQL